MTLTQFEYIIAIAREMNFSRAAESLSVGQPTLSLSLKKLEDELEVKLLERPRGSGVQITPMGAQIVALAERVLKEAAVIKEIAKAGL